MPHFIQSRFHNNQDGCQKGRVDTFELQKENLAALQRLVFTSGPSRIFAVTPGTTLQKGPAEDVLHLDPALAASLYRVYVRVTQPRARARGYATRTGHRARG